VRVLGGERKGVVAFGWFACLLSFWLVELLNSNRSAKPIVKKLYNTFDKPRQYHGESLLTLSGISGIMYFDGLIVRLSIDAGRTCPSEISPLGFPLVSTLLKVLG